MITDFCGANTKRTFRRFNHHARGGGKWRLERGSSFCFQSFRGVSNPASNSGLQFSRRPSLETSESKPNSVLSCAGSPPISAEAQLGETEPAIAVCQGSPRKMTMQERRASGHSPRALTWEQAPTARITASALDPRPSNCSAILSAAQRSLKRWRAYKPAAWAWR
jgi:hypothetical protein